MSSTKLSPGAHARLLAELEKLTTEGRVNIANVIEAARALGDLKENGEYHSAKDDQGKMEARIRQIQAMLGDAEIVDEVSTEVVGPGVTVGLRYEGDDEVEWYLLGSIEERPDDVPVMSPDSPLGRALAGHSAGETVSYEAPTGKLRVEIVEIKA